MRKVLRQEQNRGKALEVRLESEGNRSYNVVIAGMTIQLASCRGGSCESTGEGEYLQLENETYSCQSFSDYDKAKEVFDDYKTRYIY